MKRKKNLVGLLLISAFLFAQTGCALLTTRKVAMAAGKIVGKKVYEEYKENQEQTDYAEAEQGRQE